MRQHLDMTIQCSAIPGELRIESADISEGISRLTWARVSVVSADEIDTEAPLGEPAELQITIDGEPARHFHLTVTGVRLDPASVTNALRLLALPAQIQAEVSAGTLANGHAKALLGAEPAWQLTLARRVIEEGLSVREVERLAKAGPGSAVPAAKPKPPHIKELEANLFRLFGTRVKVKEKNGKGSLTLSFSGKEHFQRVVTILDKVVKQSNQL